MRNSPTLPVLSLIILLQGSIAASQPAVTYPLRWSTVVNNGDYMPSDVCDPSEPTAPGCRRFNSYNQPSVNAAAVVVLRARSRGGQGAGPPVHGIYARDMGSVGPLVKILDRATQVPQPNNRGTEFVETPAFPRIDIHSNTLATRGNHPPVWQVLDEDGEVVEQVGTSGIYTNPFGDLITGASKLGGVPDFSFFEVPEAPGTPFDVFPGAPAVTDGATLAFKGNYTVGLSSRTGVYYRDLEDEPIPLQNGTELAPAGGTNPVVLIANNSTLIPGTATYFGSTAPPSAAGRTAVFAGFDDEDDPTFGGIYLAPLTGSQPSLTTLVSIGDPVPGEDEDATFNRIGEGLSFDGRFVAFWGAWGTDTTTLVLQCRDEGNADRVAYCHQEHPFGFAVEVPVNQGIFVHDLKSNVTHAVATAPDDYDDFLFWNFSGKVPGTDEDAEPARWRSTAFVAVSGKVNGPESAALFQVAFKARSGEVVAGAWEDPVDGIYLAGSPGSAPTYVLVSTGMDGTRIDPEAIDATTGAPLPVTEMGIERDGFRGSALVVNVSMGTEETGWAGIYLTQVPRARGAAAPPQR